MCMIFVCREGIPSFTSLKRAEETNDDGAGIAWREKDSKKEEGTVVRWKKGLSAKEVWDLINEMELKKYLPFVVHFRSASQGGDLKELCHPFPIVESVSLALEGTAKCVLFHNGTFHRWEEMMQKVCWGGGARMPPGPWSDSRALAWLAYHRGWTSLRLTDWGMGRVVLFDHKGNVILQGSGWKEGVDKGVVQSGELRDPIIKVYSGNHSVWRGGRSDDARDTFRTTPLTTEQKKKLSFLWEEGDEVLVYSQQELDSIMDEVAKDNDLLIASAGGM